MHKNDEKTSINELFTSIYSEQLADLLDETDITLVDEHSPPNKPPDTAKNDIVISNIELSPTKLKIGKVEFKGKITKYALGAIIALISIGWLIQ